LQRNGFEQRQGLTAAAIGVVSGTFTGGRKVGYVDATGKYVWNPNK